MDSISTSGIIIIEDHLCGSGTNLLRGLAKCLADKAYKLVVVCDEISETVASKLFSAAGDNFVTVSAYDVCRSISGLHSLEKHLTTSEKVALIFDSLASVLIQYGVTKVVQFLNSIHFSLSESKIPILAVLHSDCFTVEEIASLKWLATTWYTIRTDSTVDISIMKNNKVLKKTSRLEISSDLRLTLAPLTSLPKKENQRENLHATPSNVIKPVDGLTFDVGLRESEALAKKNLVAPYIKSRLEKESGRIVYFPDKEDDIDEDDPDDDLDI